MVMPMTNDERVRQLNISAVRRLIDAHSKRTDEPLVLAVRYRLDDPVDIYLLEAIAGFPGSDDDELLVTEFEASAQLRILGKLVLALGSPNQIRAAVSRHDEQLAELRRSHSIEFDDGSDDANSLKRLLGLHG
jgi:hypothetical protein